MHAFLVSSLEPSITLYEIIIVSRVSVHVHDQGSEVLIKNRTSLGYEIALLYSHVMKIGLNKVICQDSA